MVELESLVHSENGGQWLYIDVYVMMRCFDELFVGMSYQRNRFCHVPDLPLRKKRLFGIDQSYGILAGNVGRKNDREFIPMYVSAKADLFNSAVRHGGTYRLAVETILKPDVVSIHGLPVDFRDAFFALEAFTDCLKGVYLSCARPNL